MPAAAVPVPIATGSRTTKSKLVVEKWLRETPLLDGDESGNNRSPESQVRTENGDVNPEVRQESEFVSPRPRSATQTSNGPIPSPTSANPLLLEVRNGQIQLTSSSRDGAQSNASLADKTVSIPSTTTSSSQNGRQNPVSQHERSPTIDTPVPTGTLAQSLTAHVAGVENPAPEHRNLPQPLSVPLPPAPLSVPQKKVGAKSSSEALSRVAPSSQKILAQSDTMCDSPVENGRQMLGGDDYAESVSSVESSDAIPPRRLLATGRQSLVPSLFSGDDSGSENPGRMSIGDSSVVDGTSSDAESDIGSEISRGFANASLPQRMEYMKLKAKKSKDKAQSFEAARFIVDNVQFIDKEEQKLTCELAIKTLKKLSIAGLVDSQYLLANLYISGIPGFQEKHKADYSKAFQLYLSAAKKDHPEALFHVGLCYEQGAGVGQSNNRALHNYRKAAVSNHPGAMFRLGMCLLRGELNQSKNPRDGVKWLKLAAKYATEKYPQALYELAILHDRGVHNVVWQDHDYLVELLTQGAALGHGGCQFKLGEAYEYGYYSVNVDPGRSVYYYSLAAANGNLEAMFELGGWYLTGVSDPATAFTLVQSDAEAYRWVSLAAEGGLPKAMFAMGYFCEMGIGRDTYPAEEQQRQQQGDAHKADLPEGSAEHEQQRSTDPAPSRHVDIPIALQWYERAAAAGDEKAKGKVKELAEKVAAIQLANGDPAYTPRASTSTAKKNKRFSRSPKTSTSLTPADSAAVAAAVTAPPQPTPVAPAAEPDTVAAPVPAPEPAKGKKPGKAPKDKKKKGKGCTIM